MLKYDQILKTNMAHKLITPDLITNSEALHTRHGGEMDTRVAIVDNEKIIIKIATDKHDARAALAREVGILDRLRSTGVAADVYEVQEKPEASYVAMEYIEGESIGNFLDIKNDWTMGRLAPSMAYGLLSQIAHAEQTMVDNDILYRDLNLDHIRIEDTGRVKFIDFDASATDPIINSDGSRTWHYEDERGTWETMAPEEFEGRGALTEAVAVYRLATLYHLMLAGRLPRDRKRHHQEHKASFSHDDGLRLTIRCTPEGNALFRKALAADPKERFQTIHEFMTEAAKIKKNTVKQPLKGIKNIA